jgi:hypothetical protein
MERGNPWLLIKKMKTIIALLLMFSALTTHAQTNLRAIMVDTNGAIQKPTNFWTANSNNAKNAIGLSETNSPTFNGMTITNGPFIFNRTASGSGVVLFSNNVVSTNPQSLFGAFRNGHFSPDTNIVTGLGAIALVAQSYLWSNVDSSSADTVGFYGAASVHTNSIAGALKPIQAEARFFDNGIANRAYGFIANIPFVSPNARVTNYYAFYAAQATNTNIFNKYGFYQQGSVMTNVFEGPLVLSNTLTVNGYLPVLVNTNGIIVKPTNFLSANNILNSTNDIISIFARMRGAGVWNMPVPYATGVITNGTASFGSSGYFRRISATASNSSIFINANPNGVRFSRGESQSGIEWSRPVWLISALTVNATSNAVARLQLGGQEFNSTNPFIGSLTNVANSSFQGMGLTFSNGNIFVEANHGGTNHSVSSSIGTYNTNNGSRVDVKLRSSGTNSITVYFNNTFVTNLAFGPTNNSGDTAVTWNVSIISQDSTNFNYIDLVTDQNTIIVE